MSIQTHASTPTSNDLLERLLAEFAPEAPSYQIVAQSAEDIQNPGTEQLYLQERAALDMAGDSMRSGEAE
jgi:hypothetical protein